jgi:integrase
MCGLRPGEMQRIEKSNILWDSVTKTGELAIPRDETKTDAGGRIVPLPEDVYKLLDGLGEYPLKRWSRLRMIRYFWKVKEAAGIKDKIVAGRTVSKTLYWTRHTYAKRYLERGGSLKVLQVRMGHESIKITADTYGHLERSTIKDIFVPSIHENRPSRPAVAPQ